ncbi:conserved hypothetical protein [Frankia canadensis]|uniref:DUF4190 domain-containing protein n=1 Tax=Frankia canadensis TaxID=1836972 RepID=A0A2I2KWH4_9ACTN|nr:hypothetical protein [Frankia canadensis]SNQ50004.1 conserved hypothetical protein [Frankia canadensis]SOU57294.1 conserved hypothetical protein [Frankia canadensis]
MTRPTAASADSGPAPAGASARASVGSAKAGGGAPAGSDPRRPGSATEGAEPVGAAAPGTGAAPHAPYPDDDPGQAMADSPEVTADELPGARALWILAFTFAAVGLFFPLSGLIAIGCGALAWRRGSGRGRVATFVAIATTLIGVVLTVVVLTT